MDCVVWVGARVLVSWSRMDGLVNGHRRREEGGGRRKERSHRVDIALVIDR